MRIPFSILCARLSFVAALAVITIVPGCGGSDEADPAADTSAGGGASAEVQLAQGGNEDESGDYEGGQDDGGEHGGGDRMGNNAAVPPPGMGMAAAGGGQNENSQTLMFPGAEGGGQGNNNGASMMMSMDGVGGGGGGGGEHGEDDSEAGMMAAFGGGQGGGNYGSGVNSGGFGPPGGGFQPPAAPAKDFALWTRADFIEAVRKKDRNVIAAIDTQAESRIGDPEFAATLTDTLSAMAGGSSANALQGKPGFPPGLEPGGAGRSGGLVPPGGASLEQSLQMLRRSRIRPLDSTEAMLGEAILAYVPQAVQGTRNAGRRAQQSSGMTAPSLMAPPGNSSGGSGGGEHGGGGAAGMMQQFGGGGGGEEEDEFGESGMMQQFGGGGFPGRGAQPGRPAGNGAAGGGIQAGLTATELVQAVVAALVRNNTDNAWRTLTKIVKGSQPTTLPADDNIVIVVSDTFSATTLNTQKAEQILTAAVSEVMSGPSSHPQSLKVLGNLSSRSLEHYLGMEVAAATPPPTGGQFGGQQFGRGIPGAPPGSSGSFNGRGGSGGLSSPGLNGAGGLSGPPAPGGFGGGSGMQSPGGRNGAGGLSSPPVPGGFGGGSGMQSPGSRNGGGRGMQSPDGLQGPGGLNGASMGSGGGSLQPPGLNGDGFAMQPPGGLNGAGMGGGGGLQPPGLNGAGGGGGGLQPPGGLNGAGFGGGGGGLQPPGGLNGAGMGGGGEGEYEGGFPNPGGFGGFTGGNNISSQQSFAAAGPPMLNLTEEGYMPAAMALWSPEVTGRISASLLSDGAQELIPLAASIPTDNVRRALFETFKNGYESGAENFVGGLDYSSVDPGLLGVLKGLARVRPARAGATQDAKQVARESWVKATKEVVLALRERLRASAGNQNLAYSGSSKVRLHRNAVVEQSIMMAVPNELTEELGQSAPAKLNVYYVRTSVTPRTPSERETIAKHYEKSAKGFRRVYAGEGMLWFDGVTRNSDGTRQTMDVIIQAAGAAPAGNGGIPGSGGGDDYEGGLATPPGFGGAPGGSGGFGGGGQQGAAAGSSFTIEVIVTISRDPQDPISDASLTSAGLDPDRK